MLERQDKENKMYYQDLEDKSQRLEKENFKLRDEIEHLKEKIKVLEGKTNDEK